MKINEITDPPVKKKSFLVIVHPGSACGSADFNIGKTSARAYREHMEGEIDARTQPVLVIDGELSAELKDESYSDLGRSITSAVRRARRGGMIGQRIWGCDNVPPNHHETVPEWIKKSGLNPAEWYIELTGAWYDPSDESGCVNAVYKYFQAAGFTCDVLDSAVPMEDEEEHSEEDDEEIQEAQVPPKPIGPSKSQFPTIDKDWAHHYYKRLEALDEEDADEFQVLHHRPERHDRFRPLIILVHPGDMVEADAYHEADDDEDMMEVRDFSLENMRGTAQELRAWRKQGMDAIVLHRSSCSQLSGGWPGMPGGNYVRDDFYQEIEMIWQNGSVLFGDDLEAAVEWLVKYAHIQYRPHIYLAGAYSDPESGCLTYIGQAIEKIVGPQRITVSNHSPPGNSPGPTWRPGT